MPTGEESQPPKRGRGRPRGSKNKPKGEGLAPMPSEPVDRLNGCHTYCSQLNIGADYSDEEREFIMAVDHYRLSRRRKFPTLTEILAIAKSLGYRRIRQ